MRGDPRSYQVAIVPDALLPDLLGLLEEERFGVIQLPPAGLGEETAGLWLEHVAEHAAEFRRNDYAVVLLDDGVWGERLDAALAALGAAPLPRAEATRESLRRHALRPLS